MGRIARCSFWLAVAMVSLLAVAAGSAADNMQNMQNTQHAKNAKQGSEVDDGLDVYFRDSDLLALSNQSLPVYPNAKAGESAKLPRDFPDAPPQIPHTVEDMYPITVDDNECLECHHPDAALSKKDVPVPESHFRVPVMGAGDPAGPMRWVVVEYQKSAALAGARYNCSMCHAPQANGVNTPNNRFVSARKKLLGK